MIRKRRKEGKVYDAVIEAFKERGLDTEDISLASLTPGGYQLIIAKDTIIGEYNPRYKQMILYSDIVKESE